LLLQNVITITAPDVKVVAVNLNGSSLTLRIPRHMLLLAKDHRE
jgi:hypothetical protein